MHPLQHPGVYQVPKHDLEHGNQSKDSIGATTPERESLGVVTPSTMPPTPVLLKGRLAKWNAKVENLAGLEARGITRVLPEERHDLKTMEYVHMFSLWFGMNLVVENIAIGFLGPLVFKLGWKDSVCIVIFASALSCCGPAYLGTFSAASGNRTMILGRYFMGYWPSKLICILNIVNQVGWGVIASVLAGQMFSAVNGGGLTVAVGCVVSALCIGLVATFGIAIVHVYERYAWAPQMFAFLVLLGSAGRNFNTSLPSVGSAGTVTANRCSFFALVYSGSIGFAAMGADFYIYHPTNTNKRLVFLMTWLGIWTAIIFADLIGVAIATGVATTPAWNDGYTISTGALLLACFDGLGALGGFCVVILALGGIANMAPATYSAALSIQCLARYFKAVPRWIWCLFLMLVELVLSVAGRNDLFHIFEDFLPLMGYWVSPWLAIVLEEHLLFHVLRRVPFDWTAWEDKRRLPLGLAAFASYLIGWAGAILGMRQRWYAGPVSLKVGGDGGDIGAWMAIAFTSVVYPPLRYLELKNFGR